MPVERRADALRSTGQIFNYFVLLLLFFTLVAFVVLLFIFCLILNREQFDFKDQRGIGTDFGARTTLTIGEARRDEELPLRPYGHELQCFRPTLDDLTHSKRGGLPTFIRAVKFLAIDERAPVVTNNCIGRGGLRASTGRQNLVLQTAGQCHNALFTLVGRQKCFAFCFVLSRCLLCLFLLLLANLVLHFGKHGLRLVVRQTRLRAVGCILQSLGYQVPVHFYGLLLQVISQS